DAQLGEQALIAERNRTTVDSAAHAFASYGAKLGHGRQLKTSFVGRRDKSRGQRMLAASFEACGQLQRGSSSTTPVLTNSCSLALPSVRVPVLSTTSVLTFSSVSSASAFLISPPAVAPRPVPTITDIGVARPNAHGQAMINTATALTSA